MQAGRTLTLLSRRPHPSLQANSTIAAAGTLILCVQWRSSRSARTSNLPAYQQVRQRAVHLASRFASSRLGDLHSGPPERAALSASRSRMRLYGHLVCAHGPTLLTNPEPCKLVEERIFYALQVRTRTI